MYEERLCSCSDLAEIDPVLFSLYILVPCRARPHFAPPPPPRNLFRSFFSKQPVIQELLSTEPSGRGASDIILMKRLHECKVVLKSRSC